MHEERYWYHSQNSYDERARTEIPVIAQEVPREFWILGPSSASIPKTILGSERDLRLLLAPFLLQQSLEPEPRARMKAKTIAATSLIMFARAQRKSRVFPVRDCGDRNETGKVRDEYLYTKQCKKNRDRTLFILCSLRNLLRG